MANTIKLCVFYVDINIVLTTFLSRGIFETDVSVENSTSTFLRSPYNNCAFSVGASLRSIDNYAF